LCEEMESLQKDIVKTAIAALRNKSNSEAHQSLMQQLQSLIASAKTTSTSLTTAQSITEIRVIDLKTGDGADLDPDDTIGQVLGDESAVVAILEKKDEDDKKKEEEARRKQQEEDERQKKILEQKDRQVKLDEEQDHKWDSLFTSLDDAHQPKDTQKKAEIEQHRLTVSPSGTKKPFVGTVMRDVLCLLSEKLGENKQTETIKSEFFKFVQEGGAGDTSRQLSKFLQHVLKEESRLAKVLKAINQSIIASPFIRLKLAFPKTIPFEDMSGTWQIIVNIVPNKEVVVTHKKSGASKDKPPQGGFEFQWELVMRFDWDLSEMLEADLITTKITFEETILEANRKEVQAVFDKFYSPV